jgi:hypothetical protein
VSRGFFSPDRFREIFPACDEPEFFLVLDGRRNEHGRCFYPVFDEKFGVIDTVWEYQEIILSEYIEPGNFFGRPDILSTNSWFCFHGKSILKKITVIPFSHRFYGSICLPRLDERAILPKTAAIVEILNMYS